LNEKCNDCPFPDVPVEECPTHTIRLQRHELRERLFKNQITHDEYSEEYGNLLKQEYQRFADYRREIILQQQASVDTK
jgi:hypothetical protein